MKQSLILAALLFASACSTNKTAEQLMANPKTFRYTFNAPLNYQKAYKVLAEMSRYCLQGSAVGNDRRTEEGLDPEAGQGEIRYINHNAFWGDDYFGYYVVKNLSRDKCQITVYHPSNALGHNDDQEVVKGWLAGSKKCPL